MEREALAKHHKISSDLKITVFHHVRYRRSRTSPGSVSYFTATDRLWNIRIFTAALINLQTITSHHKLYSFHSNESLTLLQTETSMNYYILKFSIFLLLICEFPPDNQIVSALIQHWSDWWEERSEETVAWDADARQETNLMNSLFILKIPVHDGDWKTTWLSLKVSLDIELFIDDWHCLELLIPRLGAGTQIRSCHHHGLEQRWCWSRVELWSQDLCSRTQTLIMIINIVNIWNNLILPWTQSGGWRLLESVLARTEVVLVMREVAEVVVVSRKLRHISWYLPSAVWHSLRHCSCSPGSTDGHSRFSFLKQKSDDFHSEVCTNFSKIIKWIFSSPVCTLSTWFNLSLFLITSYRCNPPCLMWCDVFTNELFEDNSDWIDSDNPEIRDSWLIKS